METYQQLAEVFDRLIRPATFPIGVKIYQQPEFPAKTRRPLADFGSRLSLCQGFSIARRFGYTVGFGPEDHECPIALVAFGLKEKSETLEAGGMAYPLYAATEEIGRRLNQTPRMDLCPTRSLLVGPLDKLSVTPDVAIIYGNPAQLNRLILAVGYLTGESVNASFPGRGSCLTAIIRTLQQDTYQIINPGSGERALALSGDDEMAFALPHTHFNEFIKALEGSQKAGGFRFPTLFPALLRRPPFLDSYDEVFKEFGLR